MNSSSEEEISLIEKNQDKKRKSEIPSDIDNARKIKNEPKLKKKRTLTFDKNTLNKRKKVTTKNPETHTVISDCHNQIKISIDITPRDLV